MRGLDRYLTGDDGQGPRLCEHGRHVASQGCDNCTDETMQQIYALPYLTGFQITVLEKSLRDKNAPASVLKHAIAMNEHATRLLEKTSKGELTP